MVDADIYGYSIPRMLGVNRRPVVVEKMIIPPVSHGLRVMSIGFFLESDQAVVWRGPMLHRALEQFLTDVHWGELDYLVVDMPPGTGDVAISLGQLLPEPDLIIVTTPQPAAQRVAARTAEVAEKTGMRVAGVVENMSFIRCTCCGEVSHPFGTGGGQGARGRARRAAPRGDPARRAAPRVGRRRDAARPLGPRRRVRPGRLGARRGATGSAPPPVGGGADLPASRRALLAR